MVISPLRSHPLFFTSSYLPFPSISDREQSKYMTRSRAPDLSSSRDSEDGRPLLSAPGDHLSTEGDTQPTAPGRSILVRSYQAASNTFNRLCSRPDLTSVIQQMEEWEKPDSGFAPTEVQVVFAFPQYLGDRADLGKMHSLYKNIGCYGPECWPTVATQRIIEIPIETFIRISEQDQSKSPMKTALKELKRRKSDWEFAKYDAMRRGNREIWTHQFNHEPAIREVINTLVANITIGVERCIGNRRTARENRSENRLSRDHNSNVENQEDGGFDGTRDSFLQ